MISHHAVSELHIIPPGQTITSDYYISEVLGKISSQHWLHFTTERLENARKKIRMVMRLTEDFKQLD